MDCKPAETTMLPTLSKALKTAAIAGLLGVGLAGAGTTSASADTIRTRCFGDDCYRERCNDLGFDCINIGYYDEHIYRPGQWRYVCDDDGNCHWARLYNYDRVYERDYDYDYGY
jgi:hypothetical protein